jgi:predicted DNA-binding transcriptional regulator AlpA
MSVMSETEVANRWGMSPKTLQRWRTEKRGPSYIKLGKTVRYRIEDVCAYENSQRKLPRDVTDSPSDQASSEVVPPPSSITMPPEIPKMSLPEALRRLNDGTLLR